MKTYQQMRMQIVASQRHDAHRAPFAWRRWRELAGDTTMRGLALAVCALLVIIVLTLIARSWSILHTVPIGELLFSTAWHPAHGVFGLGAFIAGTVTVTLVAISLAVPSAILSAIYLAEYTGPRARLMFKPVIDLLAGIPPVVYGLWGVLTVVPVVRDVLAPWLNRHLGERIPLFANLNPTGYGLFSAGFVLAMMIFPIIVSVTEEVLRAVPDDLRQALYAVGATKWEVTRVVAFRAGRAGLLAAVVLGLSRAFGETLAVLMLVGNIPQIPRSLFDGTYTLAGLIANNYGELMSVPLYESALMGAALILLVVVLFFNVLARLILDRQIKGEGR
jgi:phosphate transport system permease protein